MGLFYCLILFGAEARAHLARYGGEAQVIRGEVHTHCRGQPAQGMGIRRENTEVEQKKERKSQDDKMTFKDYTRLALNR